jgi:hypothetical protein
MAKWQGKDQLAFLGSTSICRSVCRVGSISFGFSLAVSVGPSRDDLVGRRLAEVAAHAERQGVCLGERTLAGSRCCHRSGDQLGQRLQLRVGAGDTHAVACDDSGPLGGKQSLRCGSDILRIGGHWLGQISLGGVEERPLARIDRVLEHSRVIENADGAAFSAQRMLDGELCRMHRLDRLTGDKSLLRHTIERPACVGAAVVAGAALVGRVLREWSDIGEVGEQQHGRAAEMRLERAEKAIGKQKDTLPDGNAGLAGKAPVYLGHDAGELLVAHEHRADGALVVVERVVEAAHVAAGDAEDHVDAGFLEHPNDRLGGACLHIQQLAAHGFVSSRYGCVSQQYPVLRLQPRSREVPSQAERNISRATRHSGTGPVGDDAAVHIAVAPSVKAQDPGDCVGLAAITRVAAVEVGEAAESGLRPVNMAAID